jgi:hypothetical protein
MNLKAYLANINMTLKDFGAYIEVDPRYLSSISKGRLLPGPRLARDIEKATDGVVTFDLSKKRRQGRPRKQPSQETATTTVTV